MSITKVALVGATGNLGPAILKGLLDGGFEVTVLSREGSNSTDSLASHPNQKITKVNFEDVNSIASALQGIQGLVSNVASHALMSQTKIVDAAVAAGVKRFLPSDFGADLTLPVSKSVPFNAPKVQIHEYVVEKAKSNPEFTYTFVTNGPFFDWCLNFGLFGDMHKHDMTLWDGGETKFSTTTLATVGKAVSGIFKNLEATRNKDIFIADTTLTLKDIMGIAKEIDGKEWTTKEASTVESYQRGLEEMQKPEPNMQVAIVSQLYRIMFDAEYGVDFGNKLDNEKVGLSVMSKEQVKEVVRKSMA